MINSFQFNMKYKTASKIGTGVFLTEFGAMVENPKSLEEIDSILKKTDETFMSWAYW